MIDVRTPQQAEEFLTNAFRDAYADRSDLAAYQSKCRMYHMGLQWLSQQFQQGGHLAFSRDTTNWVAENGPIRATANRITRNTVSVIAATNPQNLYVEALPPDGSMMPIESVVADVFQDATNAMIDEAGLVQAARIANAERTITGVHGIGLRCNYGQSEEGPVHTLNAFDFDATRLTLDPGNASPDLHNHDFVVYSEVLTAHALERMFGKEALAPLDMNKLQTVAQLMPVEMTFYGLSGGSLYRRYAQHSSSKAARVHFLHVRGPDGVFREMRVMVEAQMTSSKERMLMVNKDNPETLYGGSGLPYVLLRGWHRSASRAPISDVGMMIDDQDKLNVLVSLYFQHVYGYQNPQWIVDRKFFGRKTEDTEILRACESRVIIGTADNNTAPPQLIKYPEPPATLDMTMERYEQQIRQQAFRAEAHEGRTKSHVTTTNYQTAIEMSELPLDDRILDDVAEYQKFVAVLAGTTVKAIRSGATNIAKCLKRNGLDDGDFAMMASADPYALPVDLRLQNQAIRHRSRTARRQDLMSGAAVGAVTGVEIRRSLAVDLDQPLTDSDAQATAYARRTAASVMLGAPFAPEPLGVVYGEIMLDVLRRAMMSKQSERIEGAKKRLAEAIMLQQQMMMSEASMGMQAEPTADPNASVDAQAVFGSAQPPAAA